MTEIVMENPAIRTGNHAIAIVIGGDLVPKAGIVKRTASGRGIVTTGDGAEVGRGIDGVAAVPAAETGGVRETVVSATIGEAAAHRNGIGIGPGKVTTRRAPTITRVSSLPRV